MKSRLRIFLSFLILLGCTSNTSQRQSGNDVPDDVLLQGVADISGETMQKVIENISSPVEIASLLKNQGIPFNKEYLATTKYVANYNTDIQKAMALGILGADLGYLNMYNKTGSVLDNLSTIKNLADDLRLGQFFDFVTLKRLASSKTNLDSLMYISVHSFNEMDNYLRTAKRASLSAVMISGIWLEGLYLLTQVEKSYPSAKLSEKIGEQKIMLDNLMLILKNYSTNQEVSEITKKIELIKGSYSEVNITYEKGEPEAIEKDGRLLIVQHDKSIVKISDQSIQKVLSITAEVRDGIIHQ